MARAVSQCRRCYHRENFFLKIVFVLGTWCRFTATVLGLFRVASDQFSRGAVSLHAVAAVTVAVLTNFLVEMSVDVPFQSDLSIVNK